MYEFSINAGFPALVNSLDSNFFRFMVLPNDTLNIYIDPQKNKPLPDRLIFKGATASISDYITRHKIHLYDKNFPMESETPDEYNLRIDSMEQNAIDTLKALDKKIKLPEWYMKYEESNIIFTCAFLKNFQFEQRNWKYNQFIKNDLKVEKKIEDVLFKNEWMSDELFSYLSSIKADKFDTLLTPQKHTKGFDDEYRQDNINRIKGKINTRVMSYYIASTFTAVVLSGRLSELSAREFAADSSRIEKIFDGYKAMINDTIAFSFISEYKKTKLNRENYKKKLLKGQQAPSFILEDLNNNKVKLSDFKGKLICLNFWATWCGPCIQSITKKNEMVKKQASKEFVLINICLDNNETKWKELIKTKEFKGVHLKCPGNWSDLLHQKYGIGAVPHYAIVDKNGNILINNVKSDSLEYFVETNL
jgi:thiol-disulfide isomerase/thioredoxin